MNLKDYIDKVLEDCENKVNRIDIKINVKPSGDDLIVTNDSSDSELNIMKVD